MNHEPGCGCALCVDKLMFSAAKGVPIEQQIEAVVGVMSAIEAPELLPALRTLQFVRDNQAQIRKAVSKKGIP